MSSTVVCPLYPDMRVVPFVADRIPDPRASICKMPWQEYHTARNELVRACRRHGPVGSMGECPIVEGPDIPRAWPLGDREPWYYIVEDQYNDERYLYMEIYHPDAISKAWLTDVVTSLQQLPGWGVGCINIKRGYVLIFSNVLLISGPTFQSYTLDDVVQAWRCDLHPE